MRVRYCVTISREVMRRSFIAACISWMEAVSTLRGGAAAVVARSPHDENADTAARVTAIAALHLNTFTGSLQAARRLLLKGDQRRLRHFRDHVDVRIDQLGDVVLQHRAEEERDF